jgi:hypothetical protein
MQDNLKRTALRSAVLLHTGSDGLTSTSIVYEKEQKRRVSKRWRSIDKMIRKMSTAHQVASDEFARRHEASNAKKRNGGMRDLMKNISKSSKRGRKKLKFRFI